MNLAKPLPLTHSWPLYEATERLAATAPGVGYWLCNLADNALTWSAPVHELFGIPLDERPSRALALSLYLPDCRAAMELLRGHAIRHRRGFTMDARIRRADGDVRWMRLNAAPVIADRKVVRLVGTKQDVTPEYDGPA